MIQICSDQFYGLVDIMKKKLNLSSIPTMDSQIDEVKMTSLYSMWWMNEFCIKSFSKEPDNSIKYDSKELFNLVLHGSHELRAK